MKPAWKIKEFEWFRNKVVFQWNTYWILREFIINDCRKINRDIITQKVVTQQFIRRRGLRGQERNKKSLWRYFFFTQLLLYIYVTPPSRKRKWALMLTKEKKSQVDTLLFCSVTTRTSSSEPSSAGVTHAVFKLLLLSYITYKISS